METRTRRKRKPDDGLSAAPPPSGQTQRAARKTRKPASEAPAATFPEQPIKASSIVKRPSKLASDPIARRGAPPEKAMSISDLQANEDEEDEDNRQAGEEVEEEEGGGVESQIAKESRGRLSNSDEAHESQEIDNDEEEAALARRQIMALTLQDLAHASDELMKRLDKLQDKSAVARGLLKMRRNAFITIRNAYENPEDPSLFLDWSWLQNTDSPQFVLAVKKVLTVANLVTLADKIVLIPGSDGIDIASFLEKLNGVFSRASLCLDFEEDDREQCLEIALEVRTGFLIEALANKKKTEDDRAIIASIFCQPSESKNYPELLAQGPFRCLGKWTDDDVAELCSRRAHNIYLIIKRAQKNQAINDLRAQFPYDRIREPLVKWLGEKYNATFDAASRALDNLKTLSRDPDQFHDAHERASESADDSQAETQIQRTVGAADNQPSLFQDRTSYLQLANGGRKSAAADTRRDQPSSSKRAHDPFEVPDDGDDFENDQRPLGANRRHTVAGQPPPAKHQRLDNDGATRPFKIAAGPQPPGPRPPSAQQHYYPSPSRDISAPTLLTSSPADFAEVRKRKQDTIRRARSEREPTFQQRHVWTTHDCGLLIELIKAKSAAWSVIEDSADAKRFDRPRNQQAYRDKARNLKVDYLITDTVLPPCFDLVNLGKKEVDRIRSLGKNPFRRESDLDQSGRPINTEYAQRFQ